MKIELKAPDHSTLSRRLGKLSVTLPVIPNDKAVHVVVDSTGVKVYGEGEWKTRQHGASKRRTWRKLHLGFLADVRYHFSPSISLQLSYRINNFEFEDGSGLRRAGVNLRQNGLLLGVIFRF